MTYVAPLTAVEIHTLHEMHRSHPSRRARMRAHSLLLSHQGVSMPQIACMYQVDYRSVSSWIDQWQTRGLVGLYDSELTPCSRNTKLYAALRVFPIFTFTLCSTWCVMTRNRNACCS